LRAHCYGAIGKAFIASLASEPGRHKENIVGEISMDDRDVLFQEYNNLWNEKLIHKQSIRKFHNYLTYIIAIGSLVLTFHGVSTNEVIKGIDPAVLQNAVHLFFIALTPVVLLTLTFPLNDVYHIYVMAHQLGELERRINDKSGSQNLLTWEHTVCPVVYGGKKVRIGQSDTKLSNTISLGDVLLLAPFITGLCIVATVLSSMYICDKVAHAVSCNVGCLATIGYVLLILYMVAVVVMLAWKVWSYTKADGPIARVVSAKRELMEEPEREER
jgi:hypothetical protein